MRTPKFYLIILLFLFTTTALAIPGPKASENCYETVGIIHTEKEKSGLFINYHSSSERNYQIKNPEVLDTYTKMDKFKAHVQFSVQEDCMFHCNIRLKSFKILPPWADTPPVIELSNCSN